MNVLTSPHQRSATHSFTEVATYQQLVARAANVVAPVWPLKAFAAVNPLNGLEDLPFEEAVVEGARMTSLLNEETLPAETAAGRNAVNRELIKWCTLYFDETSRTIPLPESDHGFYRAFQNLAVYDRQLTKHPSAHALLKSLPDSPHHALADCLQQLEVNADQYEEFLRQSLAALPGWSGYVKWKEVWQSPADHARRPATLVEYLAVRLILTRILWPTATVIPTRESATPAFLAKLSRQESEYRDDLLAKLLPAARHCGTEVPERPAAQLVFCIDVRSEPFRRAIEARGHYQTFGFGGHFGLPVQRRDFGQEQSHASCPAVAKPRHTVCDRPHGSTGRACIERHEGRRSFWQTTHTLLNWLGGSWGSSLMLVDLLSPWRGVQICAQTMAPVLTNHLTRNTLAGRLPPLTIEPDLKDIDLSHQVDYGETALRMIGLTHNLAPLVVLCGHGSHSTNNTHASAFQCGACGGNHGGGNARILAKILNAAAVRTQLAERGITIPHDTLFIAAAHDTAIDHVEVYRPLEIDSTHATQLQGLLTDLAQARQQTLQTRARQSPPVGSPPSPTPSAAATRSRDWAETRPEWGLARNAAFVIGPRSLTQSLDLEGRCFLHSYDWTCDPEATSLTKILTGSLIVGQWINNHYLFATQDNVAYGAGSKTTHTAVGRIGVMQGNASDLMHGLPLEAVYAADKTPYHQPLRLQAVVYAPRQVVDSIIHAHPVLQKLLGNEWMALTCIDPADHQASLVTRDLTWSPCQSH